MPLTPEHPSASSASATVPLTEVAAQPTPSWHRDHPYPATLLSQQHLTGELSGKDVRHIEIDLGDSGLRYEPGDTLGIWIRNDPALVSDVLACCQLAPAETVVVENREQTLQDALSGSFELTQVHPGFIKHYAQCSGHLALLQIAADAQALRKYVENRQIVDVLKQYPAALSAEQLLSCLRRLTARQYSIASSQLVNPQRIALTVNMVRYQQDAETRVGAASGFLGWRVHEGDKLPVFVVHNPNFRLPADEHTPIIMIGPGTGIAPFRAFLQQRVATAATGSNWLFFGNPVRASDFLYEQELQNYLESGVLSRLDLAFSRDQLYKRYVQDLMREQAATLFAWLERGAHVYVCGDAKHMAEDVQQALLQIIAEEGNMDSTAARQYLVKMRQDKRYQRDVY